MANVTANKLILAFVTLIVGVILISTIASQTNARTDKLTVNSETLSIAAARNTTGGGHLLPVPLLIANPPSWQSADCPVTGFAMYNQSGALMTQNYTFSGTAGTVILDDAGNINSTASNSTTITYTYCPNDYLNSTWGATILDLVAGFFAIALMLVSVGLFYSVAKDYGIA